MELELDFYEHKIFIKVVDYYKQEAMGKWADNDLDAKGYIDLDFDVLKITDKYQPDKEIYDKDFDYIVNYYNNDIVDKILEELENYEEDCI